MDMYRIQKDGTDEPIFRAAVASQIPPTSEGDKGSIPESERSPGEGN